LKNNIINLNDFRKYNILSSDEEEICSELEEPVVIGWVTDEYGEKSIHVLSAVDKEECLWMIDLAQKVVEGDSVDDVKENE